MSGHSKWHNIQMKKGKTDAARAKVFTKIGREIAVAVKAGGPDPNANASLRAVIAKAKAANMPNDNITRGIKKASGELGNINYEEKTYEGYAPGGIAVIVEALTDKPNRTIGNVRCFFDKCGGAIGTSGCVSYLFDRLGVIVVEKGDLSEDDIMMIALDAGAEDVIPDEDVVEIRTAPDQFVTVLEAIKEQSLSVISSEVTMVPQSTIELNKEDTQKVQRLIDMLEDDDDVQNVYHNALLFEEEEE